LSVFTDSPYAALSFGDVCSNFPWFDAALRQDATALAVQQAPKKYAERYGVDRIDFFVPADGDAVSIPNDTDYVLAHGRAFEEAVCVSDDCVIETALGREGRRPGGQLMFAPVTSTEAGEAGPSPTNLRRYLLDPQRIVELHRSFRVRAEDIAASLADLARSSLVENARSELALRWAANACRMGPMVATDNANKLAEILIEKEGWSAEQATELAQALGNVSAAGWLVESKGLENAGEQRDEHLGRLDAVDMDDAIGPLRESLVELKARAEAALSMLP
jgi:hypothetical protein